MAVSVLFFCLAAAAILGALGMLMSRNPITSALWLISNLLCVAALYLTLNAPFIAVVQVLVYAGAIMVLFLFVIMLLNLASMPSLRDVNLRQGIVYLLAVIVLAQIAYVVASTSDAGIGSTTLEDAASSGAPQFLAEELFTRYMLPFEMIGVLLLAATIGAVILARRIPAQPEKSPDHAH
jgi:NADH-quinone oxidoreductase subunit J